MLKSLKKEYKFDNTEIKIKNEKLIIYIPNILIILLTGK